MEAKMIDLEHRDLREVNLVRQHVNEHIRFFRRLIKTNVTWFSFCNVLMGVFPSQYKFGLTRLISITLALKKLLS
jgi:hypothetical protein